MSLKEHIEQAAQEPQSASMDGRSATAHSLRDKIEADKYLAGEEAATKPHRGLRFTRLVPPGGSG